MENNKDMSQFTNLYSLSKTLRFELVPIDENGNTTTDIIGYIENIIEKDEKVKEAYRALKPELDKIHEQIITDGLMSKSAKGVDFSAYYKEYQKGKEKKIEEFEKILRQEIGETFEKAANKFKAKVGNDEKSKPILKKDGIKCLKESGIVKYLEKIDTDKKLKKYLNEILWGYFDNYNITRANYYEYKEEKATAVASRIVSDNLPKFCDNLISFEKRKQDYKNVYNFLKDNSRETQIKDADSGQMIEAMPINNGLFTPKHFNNCLTQKEIEEYNRIIGHYNSLINLYNQARREEKDFVKLKHFKKLYKQIGCGKGKVLFFTIDNNVEFANLLNKIKANSKSFKKYLKEFIEFLQEHKKQKDWSGIYWSKAAANKISNKYLENWYSLKEELKKNKVCVHKNSRTKELEFNDVVELSGLFNVTLEFKEDIKKECENKRSKLNLIDLICEDIEINIKSFNEKINTIATITDYKNDVNKKEIKECLDFLLNVIHLIKNFSVKEKKVKGTPIDSELSNYLLLLLRNDDFAITKWYDAIRSYLTKKPQDDAKKQKLKLNFEKGNLLNGFVDSHSESDGGTQYGGYIFRKKNTNNEYEYFLGISKDAKLFRCYRKDTIKDDGKSEYERLDYYQAKSTTYFDNKYSENKEILINKVEKLIDAIVGSEQKKGEIKKRDGKGKITPSVLFDRLKKSESEGFKNILQNKDIIETTNNTINQLREYCKKYENTSDKLKELIDNKNKYFGIDGFKQIVSDLQNIAKENKVYDFFNIDKSELKNSLSKKNNKLYLFKISNKDLKERDLNHKRKDYKGIKQNYNDNLHTLFFKALMREFDNSSIDIGKGEIFFRKIAIKEQRPENIHKANLPIYRRSDKQIVSEFNHNIIKDKRFTQEKLQFHISIGVNYKKSNCIYQENVKDIVSPIVNDNWTKRDDVLFLGIDRGEKNLIYYSLINQKGEILERGQGNFNTINNKDYYSAIMEKTLNKKKAQQNWSEIGEIKNIKDGYISLVVHEIAEKIKNRPIFIILEDLNSGFKRGRFCFEQQVYQKFELALARKLNYLVYKEVEQGESGSAINGFQFTPPVLNYQDIENKKQLGIMLYVRANYTSVTDPVTGWRKTIYLKKGSEDYVKTQILETFNEIRFDGQDYFFEYSEKNANKKWKLWSSKKGKSLERYRFKRGKDKNESIIEQFDVKECLDKLFKDFDKNESLRKQLNTKSLLKINEYTAWESLRFVIDLIMQIRNNGDKKNKQDENFLLSPVRNEDGEHFDSRDYQNQDNPKLPKDADANGAFNIARKGLIAFEHIKHKRNTKEHDLFISDEEWDLWLLNREEWKRRLSEFSTRKQKRENKEENNQNV
jgi:hypothetical protein